MSPSPALATALPEDLVLRPLESNLLINNRQVRDREVGTFFADLARQIFGGVLLPQTGVPSCDAYLRDLGAWTEIKGRSDVHPVLLKETQLNRYFEIGDSDTAKPPVFVYVLWQYQSHERRGLIGRRVHLLTKAGKRRQSLRSFLAKKTHTCHIFDIGVIEKIRREFGVKDHIWPSYESTPVVALSLKFLCDLRDGAVENKKLSTHLCRHYRAMLLKVNFLYEGTVVSFTIHAIVLPKTYRRLLRVAKRLNGQLFIPES